MSYLLQMIPPELQSDFAASAGGGGGGGERLGFLPGTRPMPAINLPPTLPDLEYFAASSAMTRRSPLRTDYPTGYDAAFILFQELRFTVLSLCPPSSPSFDSSHNVSNGMMGSRGYAF